MYEKHFNFSDAPFTIAPNPRYLYLTDQHREALAHLSYGLQENGGFILLTGEVGTGKTTVCRCLLEQIPDNVNLALVLTPTLNGNELLEAICDEFGIRYDKNTTSKTLTDALNQYLLDIHAKGQRAAVVIDEAQNLDVAVLEQLRLLTNLETNEQKLMQIILIGQPEFLAKLEQPELRQLSQRIIARFHLKPLKAEEVRAYVTHRLKVAGGNASIFPQVVALRVAQLSKGIPRLINLLCDRALLGCYVQDKHQVDMQTLEQAAREVFGDRKLLSKQVVREQRMSPRLLPKRGQLIYAGVALAVVAAVAYLSPLVKSGEGLFFEWLPSRHTEVAVAPSSVLPESPSDSSVSGLQGVESVQDEGNRQKPTAPLDWATLVNEEYSEAKAYSALFSRWQARYSHGNAQTPCGFALRNQLDCWHKRGTFNDLRRLNRPVLLRMVSDESNLFHAALLEINGNRMRLGLGTRTMEVSRNEVERQWDGEFTLIWRRPPSFSRTLRPGDKSNFIDWVAKKISRLEGRKVSGRKSQAYDFALVSRIRSLQQRCNLRVDGLVGRETVILINSLTETVPMLLNLANRRCARRLNV